MILKVGGVAAVELHDSVIHDILNIYPEEELVQRPFFVDGLTNKCISYKDLLRECESIRIPWQMFFLTPKNLKKELDNIDNQRKIKFDKKFFVKRKGDGDITSKRIIDHLIRLQNYITQNFSLPKNNFCGIFKGKNKEQCAKIFLDYFDIDIQEFRSKKVEKALEYLIEKIVDKNINVSRGVLKGGVLPELKQGNNVYKNTSGFVIRDEQIPFIFLPDEVNPEEAAGRRIYTLVYLLVCIGLDQYDFFLETKFKAAALKTSGPEVVRHDIATSILLPEENTSQLRSTRIESFDISEMAIRHKVTPTAVLVTLRRRGIISQPDYETLSLSFEGKVKQNTNTGRRPKIWNAVKKFCGKKSYFYVNEGIRSATISSAEAQHLLFGRVHKKNFKEYCIAVGL